MTLPCSPHYLHQGFSHLAPHQHLVGSDGSSSWLRLRLGTATENTHLSLFLLHVPWLPKPAFKQVLPLPVHAHQGTRRLVPFNLHLTLPHFPRGSCEPQHTDAAGSPERQIFLPSCHHQQHSFSAQHAHKKSKVEAPSTERSHQH